mmetsp:Transcript_48186/g.109483  ORF Transcript_48186/g.109483 Transcript_48186/m.109483 type:complete len:304 (+) Transcript_48186:736-1647(+)
MSLAILASCAALRSACISLCHLFMPLVESGSSSCSSPSLSSLRPPSPSPSRSALPHILRCFLRRLKARKCMRASMKRPIRTDCSVAVKILSRWSPGCTALRSDTSHLGSSSSASSGTPSPSRSSSPTSSGSSSALLASASSRTMPKGFRDGTNPKVLYLEGTWPKYQPSYMASRTSPIRSSATWEARSLLCSNSSASLADSTHSRVRKPCRTSTSTYGLVHTHASCNSLSMPQRRMSLLWNLSSLSSSKRMSSRRNVVLPPRRALPGTIDSNTDTLGCIRTYSSSSLSACLRFCLSFTSQVGL